MYRHPILHNTHLITPISFLNPTSCTDKNIITLNSLKHKSALQSLFEKTHNEKYLDLISDTSSDIINIYSDSKMG